MTHFPHSKKYFSRDLSWLEFNQRVLDESLSPRVPLLERLKFLAISSSNLDEFFMVRVGSLYMMLKQDINKPDMAGLTPSEQLEAIQKRTCQMVEMQYKCYNDDLVPHLAENSIHISNVSDLTPSRQKFIEERYKDQILPVLTPIALYEESTHHPIFSNLNLHILVRLKPNSNTLKSRFAVVPVPLNIQRIIPIPRNNGAQYILVDDLIQTHIHLLFPGEEIAETVPFRLTRNADINLEDELAADLLSEMEGVLNARTKSNCIRLELDASATVIARKFLSKLLKVSERFIFAIPGPINLKDFFTIAVIDGFSKLKYEQWLPHPSPEVDLSKSIFKVISEHSVLLYHPYESFEPVIRLVQEAAEDPKVLAIKQILYRVSDKSALVSALKKAAQKGKAVTVIVELKARFDEARNIEWARDLESCGATVIYGIKGLKTHAKATLIVRKESSGVVRYMHFGTGNYNEQTARIYTDMSYLTCQAEYGRDASEFFNAITGFSEPNNYTRLTSAPLGLRERLLDLISQEIIRKEQGKRSRIVAKMNSLVDQKLIDAFYRASKAGVKVSLNIRGICCLRPGVKGLSENIEVVSIVDRFLEHARIFYFYHGGAELMFIASADGMSRNLDRRVELLVPVEDVTCKKKLKTMLEIHFKDTAKGRYLQADGVYGHTSSNQTRRLFNCQESLYKLVGKSVLSQQQRKRTKLEPHRPPSQQI